MAESSTGSTAGTPNLGATTEIPPLQTNPQTVQEKIADALVGFGQAGHMVGLAHVCQTLADSRQRIRDTHRAMAKAVGMEDTIGVSQEQPMNLMVTGDVHMDTTTPQASNPQASNGGGSLVWKIVPWALAAASGAGLIGTGVGALLTKAVPAAVQRIESKEGFLIELVPPGK